MFTDGARPRAGARAASGRKISERGLGERGPGRAGGGRQGSTPSTARDARGRARRRRRGWRRRGARGGGARRRRRRRDPGALVVPTAGSWEAAVCDARRPVEAHGSAWCAPCGTGVWSCTRRARGRSTTRPSSPSARPSSGRSKPAPRRARPVRCYGERRVGNGARGRGGGPTWTCPRGRARRERGARRGTGFAADAAHRACGALERACDQRRLAHASLPSSTARGAPPRPSGGAAACARLGQKARAWRALAKDGRARTKEALGDLELLKTQLEEARAAEARAATLAVRARELEADRRKLRDEIATRDAAQRLGRLERERRPSVSPLSPATARRRSPSPRGFRSVAFAEATPPPRASLTPSGRVRCRAHHGTAKSCCPSAARC